MRNNLNALKLLNGTRLRVLSLKNNIIKVKTIMQRVVKLYDCKWISIEFKRVQLLVKLCFAISINNAKGQTTKVAGIDNTDPYFAHGKFYIARYRVSSEKNLFKYVLEQKTNNIVYRKCLNTVVK